MSGQILSIELTAIAHEAKRKHSEIRTSLADLKALPSTSEQQLAADLSRRPYFVDPLVLAASSKNVRLANSALVCLQRLVVINGLPRSRLADVLNGFSASTSMSLDIQLKILQALPALAQNYADDLSDQLLALALRVCAVLQNVKVPTVSAVAAATLQQLVVLVFDKVVVEDAASKHDAAPNVADVDGNDGRITVKQATYDALRLLQDLACACDGQKLVYLDLSSFPLHVSLELIFAALSAHGDTFAAHPELVRPLKLQVVPALIRLLSDRQSFAITLRALRIVPLLVQRHVPQMIEECEVLLGLLTHLLDPDSSPWWKRIMVMEVFKSLYSTPGTIIRLYMQYDQQERSKAIVRDNISSFVRLSTEKPALIGLGQQSTAPSSQMNDAGDDPDTAAVEAAGGVAGIISSTVTESSALGVSSTWSSPRVPMMELLDKTEAPQVPETYIYSLVLECLNNLSDGLAKVILPLTMSSAGSRRPVSRPRPQGDEAESNRASAGDAQRTSNRLQRSSSYRSSTVPINPLTMEKIPAAPKVKAIAGLLEDCWPALLATSSTFLYSALDNDFYRGLIRTVQRYTQVAGLLDLAVARDAFLTTLGKAAVPANLTSSLAANATPSSQVSSPLSLFNSKGLLSINDTITQSIQAATGGRRPSYDPTPLAISTRNLLCLRALINLAIALGPTLKDSFAIILGTLQHADLYLDQMQQGGSSNNLAMLSQEIEAVSSAAKRMIESTADYPNDAFLYIADIFCASIDDEGQATPTAQTPTGDRRHSQVELKRRASSIAAAHAESPLRSQDRLILLSKFGTLVDLNAPRFASYEPGESGWQRIAECLISVATGLVFSKASRMTATDIICRSSANLIRLSADDSSNETVNVQKLALSTLQHLLSELLEETTHIGAADLAVLCRTLDCVKSIVEDCGESLITGWDILLDILEMTFTDYDADNEDNHDYHDGLADRPTRTNGTHEGKDGKQAHSPTAEMLSPELGRIAFSVVQIICSDFLPALKANYLITTAELLHKFSRQSADVNMSLTAIALFSDVSTFLLRDDAKEALEFIASPEADKQPQAVFNDLRVQDHESRAAQWMILLNQLSEVAVDDRDEIRNGAFQTLLRIVTDQSLDPHAFQFALTGVLLKTLENNLAKQEGLRKAQTSSNTARLEALDQASKSLIEGVAKYIAQNSQTFERTSQFQETWRRWTTIMTRYLRLQSLVLSQAVYLALAATLTPVIAGSQTWVPAVAQVLVFYDSDHSMPTSASGAVDHGAQQDAFIAYISCATEVMRLAPSNISLDQIKAVAEHAADCIGSSATAKYGNDATTMTQLQSAALKLLRSLRTDIDGWPPHLLRIAAGLLQLPTLQIRDDKTFASAPRFIALAKETMTWLIDLIKHHGNTPNALQDGAVDVVLKVFATHISIKYHWPKTGKPPTPWSKATTSVLDILPVIIPQITSTSTIESAIRHTVWQTITTIASAIVHGDYSPLDIPTSFADIQAVERDEQSDARSLLTLRSLVLPSISSPLESLVNHRAYCQALFTASIVHPLRPSETAILSPTTDPLSNLLAIRSPTFDVPVPSRREDLAYLCLAELISMASAAPQEFEWGPSSTFETPYEPPTECGGEAQKRDLARAAAPYVVARFAVVVKGYIADQPLRGRGRMPISVREELLWCLERVRDLRVVEGALGENKDGGGLAHVRMLYPLLVEAVGVAGDGRCGDKEILRALMAVLDVVG